ncbi:MAG: Eco57I restriction-modification methylase domain-containing protein [Candidatus Helarchaeota archaeon]
MKIQDLKKTMPEILQQSWNYLPIHLFGKRIKNRKTFTRFENKTTISFECSIGELIFAIHTYLSLIIKFITIHAIAKWKLHQKFDRFMETQRLSNEEVRDLCQTIENEHFFQGFGIENFLKDTEHFAWYLLVWDGELAEWVKKCIDHLLITPSLAELQVTDKINLFKVLYQKLLHPSIRRYLGEVFTPTWIIDFILSDVGYKGDLSKKILDPACGLGGFLQRILRQVKLYHQEKEKRIDLGRLMRNIAGFDVNPLAILASRATFLLEITDILPIDSHITIPVYKINTIDLESHFFAQKIRDFQKYFDYIVGNPPWINWEYLAEPFKRKIQKLWKHYRLFSFKGWESKLGFAKYDISALFVYRSMEYFLKPGGILEFLIPQVLIHGSPGRGFRRYEVINESNPSENILLGVQKIHNLTNFQPFESINTRTMILQLKRNEETQYPVQYFKWDKLKKRIPDLPWNQIKPFFRLKKKIAVPISPEDLQSPLVVAETEEEIKELQTQIFRPSEYKGHEGANTEGLNAAFWISNLQKIEDGRITFQQLLKGFKKKIKAHHVIPIEPEIVYPLIRTGDLQRWYYSRQAYIIFTPKYDKTIADEQFFRQKFPATYKYLRDNFHKELLNRKSFQKKSMNYPFYVIYGTKEMKSPYKVCWKRMGSKIDAAVITEYADPYIGMKPPIPQETIIFIDTQSVEEAYYLCAILNSKIFFKLLNMVSMPGSKSFASANILQKIRIPKFTLTNPLMTQLVEASKQAHLFVNDESKLYQTEKKINSLVEQIFFPCE